MLSVSAMVLVLGVAIFAFLGRPVALPDWATDRAEAFLADRVPHLDVSLGNISVVVEDNWHPRIRVRDLSLREANSSSRIRLEQVDVGLDMASLLARQIAPSKIGISGIFVSLRRLGDGAINVSFGEGATPSEALDANMTLPNLGKELGLLLDRPALAMLKEVRLEALHLRYEDVRAGKGWSIDGGQARLQRDGDGVSIRSNLVALGARSFVSTIEMHADIALGTGAASFGMTFEDMPASDIASQSPAVAWLGVLQAPISGSLRASTTADGVLGPTSVALQIGEGAIQPNDQVKPIPFQSAQTYLTYDPSGQKLTLDEFAVVSDWVSAKANGQALLGNLEFGLPKELLVQLEFTQMDVNPNDLADSPISLDNAFADFRLQLDPFELSVGQLVLSQQGQQLRVNGMLAPEAENWRYRVDGTMTKLAHASVLGVWPERLKPRLRTWISENINTMSLNDINVALRSKGAEPPDFYLDFRFSDLEMRFMKTMPLLRHGHGVATLVRNRFLVGAEGGIVTADEGGDMDIAGTGFLVHNTRIKQSPATVRLAAKGPITAALSLLNREPLSVMDKANLPVDLTKGDVEGVGTIDLTLKPKLAPDEVAFTVDVALSDLETTHFIEDKVITGDMTGTANNREIVIEGEGKVGALPVYAKWQSKLGKEHDGSSKLTGYAELSQRAIDEFDVGFPDGTFSGQSRADFQMDIARGIQPKLTIDTDMSGLGISFPPLGYSKPAATKGTTRLEMTISEPPSVDRFVFEAPGLAVQGDVVLRSEGGLDRVNLSAFEVGNWLSGSGSILGRGEGLAPGISIETGSFDVRGLPSGESGAGDSGDIGPISASLQRVQISEDYYLTEFRGQFQGRGGFGGDFTGLFNGLAPIAGEMVSQAGGQAFKISSQRGGDVINALGFARASSGNSPFQLHLIPVPNAGPGVYDGTATVRSVRIQDAPAFAELLNAVSVVGLLEQLSGPGILMTEIATEFRLSPDRLRISQGSAVGASMGLSFDGVMDLATGLLDFQGVFSPVYFVNAVGRVISKKGEGLIGFNYRLQGTADDMTVSVNPMSALTPGFLREIFRAPSGENPEPPPPPRTFDPTQPSEGLELK